MTSSDYTFFFKRVKVEGKCIPKLVLHGYWEGGMYCVGLSLCGTVPEELSETPKQSVLSSIDAIHDRGVLHNDIKKENILVDSVIPYQSGRLAGRASRGLVPYYGHCRAFLQQHDSKKT